MFSENDLKDQLFQEIEEFKKCPKEFSNLITSAIAFRQTTLELHQKGLAFAVDLKKVGEKYPTCRWAGEMIKRSMDQEAIEKLRFDWQAKIWDNFILPMMETAESDKKELLNVEKKLKNISQQLINDYKQALKKIKKLKKKASPGSDQALRDTLKANQETLLNYFHIYRDTQYSKYLTALCNTIAEEKNFFNNAGAVLQSESWKAIATSLPPSLPEIDSIFPSANLKESKETTQPATTSPVISSPTQPILSQSSSSPKEVVSSPESLPILKSGYLMKKGGNRHNWKKRWFTFDSVKIQYFDNEAVFLTRQPPLGTILVSDCKNYELQPYKKKENILKINTPNRIYLFTHENPQELINWSDILKNYIKLTSISNLNFDNYTYVPPETNATSNTNVSSEWIQYTTDDGIPYWYNSITQESVWINPNSK